MARGQKEVQEAWKELEAARQEREHSAKRLDPLEEGNSRLVGTEEKQDHEGKFLGGKIRDLTGQVSGLQWSLAGVEERRETEVSSITSELAGLSLPAQGGEDTSSLRLQVAVGGGGGVEEMTKLNESLNLEIQSLKSSLVEQQSKLARERSLVLQLESELQHREAALRQLQAGARERQDRAASWCR